MSAANEKQVWPWKGIDHARAVSILMDHLPEIGEGSLEPLGQGDFCLAFRQGQQVIRVARHAETAAALRREACVLSSIAERLPLPVPRLAFFTPPDCPPYTVHRAVNGATLTRERWEDLPAAAQDRSAADLANFLRVLHSLPVEIGQGCGLEVLAADSLAQELRETTRAALHGLLKPHEQVWLEDFLETCSREDHLAERQPALLHCDIAPGHVLYDPETGALAGIIDFGDIAIGDPARDFIYVYEDFGPAMLNAVLGYYAGMEDAKLVRDIHKWYLLEAIAWTVNRIAEQQTEDVEHGLTETRRELAWMMRE